MKKRYTLLTSKGAVLRARPGRYAGWDGGRPDRKIFGRLTCASGKRLMRKEHCVFFATWDDAIAAGFRPCMKCRPQPTDRYVRLDGEWTLITPAETKADR